MFQNQIQFNLPNAAISYYPNFFSQQESNWYFEKLLKETPWQQDDIKVFGKTHPQPRLTALYGTNGKSYSYSHITMHPHLFTPELLEIKQAVEMVTQTQFTTCLLNLYRNGKDSNGWHADNEKELGINPVIASVSFGDTRKFKLKHRTKDIKQDIELTHGSLLIMAGETQHHWLHAIPKTAKQKTERINLTFRVIA